MSLYKVTWTIEVDADSPKKAAELAREIQVDENSTATFFSVTNMDETDVDVDVRRSNTNYLVTN
jgi:hypothetical protein